jgi:hypothetical protein
MNFKTSPHEHGFYLIVDDSSERTRMAAWCAEGEGSKVSGQVELGFLDEKTGVFIHTGFRPEFIKIDQIRDQTPGVYQPVVSQIPAGSCLLCIQAESAIKGKIDIQISPTGHPNDSRSCGSIPLCTSPKKLTIPIVMRQTWKRLFIKKMEDFEDAVVLSGIMVVFPDNTRRYLTMNHLIKPEHAALKKSDKNRITFPARSPRYVYFNIGFQKQ